MRLTVESPRLERQDWLRSDTTPSVFVLSPSHWNSFSIERPFHRSCGFFSHVLPTEVIDQRDHRDDTYTPRNDNARLLVPFVVRFYVASVSHFVPSDVVSAPTDVDQSAAKQVIKAAPPAPPPPPPPPPPPHPLPPPPLPPENKELKKLLKSYRFFGQRKSIGSYHLGMCRVCYSVRVTPLL